MKTTRSTTNTALKRGPKPKPAAEQLSQLTVRMSPKLKFGVELLARARHRSLSEAVEWALKVGLNAFEIGTEELSLGDLVDLAWDQPPGPERTLAIYRSAPELLSVEERAACELVVNSLELDAMDEQISLPYVLGSREEEEEVHKAEQQRRDGYFTFVRKIWGVVLDLSAEFINAGKSPRKQRLLVLLGVECSAEEVRDVIATLAEVLPETVESEAWPKVLNEVSPLLGGRKVGDKK